MCRLVASQVEEQILSDGSKKLRESICQQRGKFWNLQ